MKWDKNNFSSYTQGSAPDHPLTLNSHQMIKIKKIIMGTPNCILGKSDLRIQNFASSIRSDHLLIVNSTHPRKMVKMKKYSYWNINSDLEVIWPENLKFCILDHVRPSVNCKLSPPTRNGQMKKSNYRDTNLDPGVTRPSFSITNWVRLWGHQFGSRGNLTLQI